MEDLVVRMSIINQGALTARLQLRDMSAEMYAASHEHYALPASAVVILSEL